MHPVQRRANGHSRNLARFGVFEVDLDSRELRKSGLKIRLQAKPFELLRALIEQPGAVVSREELGCRLWPEETFVDFESGLNTAINRLRTALGDSAEHPRYIETLARTGYRFIGPVQQETAPPVVEKNEVAPLTEPLPPVWMVQRKHIRLLIVAALAGLAAAVCTLMFVWPKPGVAQFRQLTFHRGNVFGARFSPDGQTVLYSAEWERAPRTLFQTNAASPESRPLGFPGMSLSAISAKGELALLTSGGTMNISGGVLSRVPLNGGAPLELAQNIMSADWSSDGTRLAVVRAVRGTNQLEFPIGTVLDRTAGWLSHPRFSPDGKFIAYAVHPVRHDDAGALNVVSIGGKPRSLSSGWLSIAGVAWHPKTQEIWFTATRQGALRSVWAANIDGHVRPVAQAPGILTLRDIAPDGRVLVSRDVRRLEMAGRLRGDAAERVLSWLDWSRIQDLSDDGSLALFDEGGEGAGPQNVIYVHRSDGTTVRVGEGRAMSLSPDGSHVLALGTQDRNRFRVLSIAGEPPRVLAETHLECQWGRLFPSGDRLLILGNEPAKPLRLYVQSVASGVVRPITPAMAVRNVAISPDSERVAVLTADRKLALYPANGGDPVMIEADEPLAPLRWSRDGQHLFVQHLSAYSELPARVSRLRISTRTLEPWKRIAPVETTGVTSITGIALSGDEHCYAYSFRRLMAELFVVQGWK